MQAASRARPAFELGLDLCVFLFLPVLTLANRGVAALEVAAGLCALGLVAPQGMAAWRRLRGTALVFAALLLWGLLSALWGISPQRSLLLDARLLGLAAAGLALIAAAPALAAPQRMLGWLCAGLVLALALTIIQDASGGMLTVPFRGRLFVDPGLNQVEGGFVLLIMPLAATLIMLGRAVIAAVLAVLTLAVTLCLVGDTAQLGFFAGLVGAGAVFLSRRWLTPLAAAAAAIVVLAAPLIFPALIRIDALRHRAEHLAKMSLWHRFEIWSFVGDRIAEHPFLGWGLDSSRAIPGGSELFAPTSNPWGLTAQHLPLHPHNVTLQIWLELGVPGAVLLALLVARLWLALGAMKWPRLYAAAVGGSLTAAFVVGLASYGLWQEWWIGTDFLMLFLILVMGRLSSAVAPPRDLRHQPAPPPGHPTRVS
jgi:O-antigen ligase